MFLYLFPKVRLTFVEHHAETVRAIPKCVDMVACRWKAVHQSRRGERQRSLGLAVIFAAPRWLWSFTSPSLQRQRGYREGPNLVSRAGSPQPYGKGTDEDNEWILKIRDLLQDLLKRNMSYKIVREWNSDFNLATKRNMGAWSFTTNFTEAIQEICERGVGQPVDSVDLEKEGSQVDGTYAARSDLDRVKKRDRKHRRREVKVGRE